jgi:hypothetical protein
VLMRPEASAPGPPPGPRERQPRLEKYRGQPRRAADGTVLRNVSELTQFPLPLCLNAIMELRGEPALSVCEAPPSARARGHAPRLSLSRTGDAIPEQRIITVVNPGFTRAAP